MNSNKYNAILANTVKNCILTAKKPDKLPLNTIIDKLKDLSEDSKEVSNYLDKLREIVGKAQILANSSKLMKEIEENLGILKEARDNLREAEYLLEQITTNWEDDNKAPKLIKEAKTLVSKFNKQLSEAQELVQKLAKSQKPAILNSNKNELLKDVLTVINSQIKKYIKDKEPDVEPELDIKNSKYMLDTLDNAKVPTIRFARFIPLTNLPLTNNKTKNLYATFVINLFTNKTGDKLVPSKLGKLEFTLTDSVISPSRLPKTYVVESEIDIVNILEVLSHQFKLKIFGIKLAGSSASRREKVREKLNILNDNDIKMKIDGSFVLIKFPIDKIELNESKNKIVPRFEEDLLEDLARFSGVPVRNAKSNILREKMTVKDNDYVIVTYRVINTDARNLTSPNKIAKKETDFSNEDWINELRKQVKLEKKEISSGLKYQEYHS